MVWPFLHSFHWLWMLSELGNMLVFNLVCRRCSWYILSSTQLTLWHRYVHSLGLIFKMWHSFSSIFFSHILFQDLRIMCSLLLRQVESVAATVYSDHCPCRLSVTAYININAMQWLKQINRIKFTISMCLVYYEVYFWSLIKSLNCILDMTLSSFFKTCVWVLFRCIFSGFTSRMSSRALKHLRGVWNVR